MTMTATETLAMGKAVKDAAQKKAKKELEAGTHEVDMLVRVFGTLTLGEDYEQNKTAAMPQIKMLLAAIMLNGISVKAFVKRYLDREFEVPEDKEEELKEIWKELADSFKATFSGKLTAKLTTEKIENASENAA